MAQPQLADGLRRRLRGHVGPAGHDQPPELIAAQVHGPVELLGDQLGHGGLARGLDAGDQQYRGLTWHQWIVLCSASICTYCSIFLALVSARLTD